jgi:hypothetical protein
MVFTLKLHRQQWVKVSRPADYLPDGTKGVSGLDYSFLRTRSNVVRIFFTAKAPSSAKAAKFSVGPTSYELRTTSSSSARHAGSTMQRNLRSVSPVLRMDCTPWGGM